MKKFFSKKIWCGIVILILINGVYFNNFSIIKNKKPIVESTERINYSEKGYTPKQIKKAYGMDKLKSYGKDQNIAIITSYGSPSIENDV